MNMIDLIRTLISRFLLLIVMVLFAIPFLIAMCFSRERLYKSGLFFWLCDTFYRCSLAITFLPIKVVGEENIPERPAIIVANHQSSIDIPIIGSLLDAHPHVWLAKVELMESPILRFVLPKLAVLIDMSTPQKGMRSLIQAINMIEHKNRHAIIFPEGGRYVDGKIHDFYSGFVILAKKTGRPVVPICIFGLNKAYPPDSFLCKIVPIKVIVGAPMKLQDDETDEQFKERVYNWFITQKED